MHAVKSASVLSEVDHCVTSSWDEAFAVYFRGELSLCLCDTHNPNQKPQDYSYVVCMFDFLVFLS